MEKSNGNNRNKATSLCVATLLGALLATPAFANSSESEEGTFSVGLGVLYYKSVYKDWNESEVLPIPYFAYTNGNFYVEGIDMGYNLLKYGSDEKGFYVDLTASPGIGYDYETDDSPVFAGMDNRDDFAFGVGGSVGMYGDYGVVEVSAQRDVAGAHEGTVASISYSLPMGDEDLGFQFVPHISATYQSANFNDYYFGVRAHEATSTRAAYKAGGGTNFSAGATLIYMLSPQWNLTVGATYEKLDDNVKNSPLVEEDSLVSGFAAVIYSF